ncbi:MAG: hypothetical protein GXX98_08080 [Planctomycetes bacterium]|nr:hypothetical protein [Planctomycetota bacterium]
MGTKSRNLTCLLWTILILLLCPRGGLSQDDQGPGESPSEEVSDIIPAGWTLLDEVAFDLYLEAGRHLGVRYDPATQTLHRIEPRRDYELKLTAAAEEAVNRAPRWLRHELTWVFTQIPADDQDLWAAAIHDANDPYVDEIAFAVAHSSPQYLTSGYGSPDLFVRNAELIYENAAALDYVEVIDVGSSDSNDDYYSTTRYVQSFIAGTRSGVPSVTTIDAPRDVYYWYVVHPKVSSEIPAFIDPHLVESNRSHNENIAPPPAGAFWRDYLFNHADPGYPVLRDRLSRCTIAGDGTSLGGDSAIGAVNGWINASMSFTSEGERPHQPNRIYDKHIGRCGEYADLAAAAARAALIPCTSIASTSTDHIWNEFWHERWIQWEPVNNSVDEPLVYATGWGKVFGTVYEIRSDGQVRSATDRYTTGTATIDLTVTDALGHPVDGAEVRLYAKSPSATRFISDFYALTDNEGCCSFVVGDRLDYAARVTSTIGSEPNAPNQRIELVSAAVAGERYAHSVTLAGVMPALDAAPIEAPAADDSSYRLIVSFAVPEQLLAGDVWADDVAPFTQHLEKVEGGRIDFFVADGVGYEQSVAGAPFEAFGVYRQVGERQIILAIPPTADWRCVFSNAARLNNLQHLVGTVRLYAH